MFDIVFATEVSTAAVPQSNEYGAASTFLLVNLTKVSTAAHSMYFPKSQFQLGSPLILVMAPELTASFTPTSKDHGR